MKELKIVIVGDHMDQKKKRFIQQYKITDISIFDSVSKEIKINKESVLIQLQDTTGKEDYDRLRPLDYVNCNLYLLLFDLNGPISFENISAKWFAEVRHYSPETPIVLVGIQDSEATGTAISEEDIKKLTKSIGAKAYFTCNLENKFEIEHCIESSVRSLLIKNYKIQPQPTFFQNFSSKNDVAMHVNQIVAVSQGARDNQNSLLKLLPNEVLLTIFHHVGSHLTKNLDALLMFNRLLLGNIRESAPQKLNWNRKLILDNKVIEIYPERENGKKCLVM